MNLWPPLRRSRAYAAGWSEFVGARSQAGGIHTAHAGDEPMKQCDAGQGLVVFPACARMSRCLGNAIGVSPGHQRVRADDPWDELTFISVGLMPPAPAYG